MAKIDTSGWKPFVVGELFPSMVKPPVLHARQVVETDEGIPYVVRTKFNNGIKCRVHPVSDVTPSPAGVITWGAENAAFFYQAEEFLSGRDIYYVDTRPYSATTCMFLAACLQTVVHKYPYNYGLFPDLLKEEQIRLPVDVAGEPNWAYMDEYMSAVMKESEASLERLKQTDGEKHAVDASGWKEFKLTDIFRMNNTKSIVQKDVVPDSGTVPYVTAQAWNNGVMTYIDCPDEWLDKGDCIMIGGKTLTFSYQAQAFCSNDSHNIALHLKDAEKASEMRYLFLIAALRGSLYQKYSWGDSISMKTIKNDVFQLPVDASGKPDWAYMDEYMRTVMEHTKSDLLAIQSIN
jgi:hypothetical protein